MLGKRAELFFAEAIKQSSTFELLASNLQIIHEKRTLGEFDFFLKDVKRNQIIHVELVYKFYIFDPDFKNELEGWIGPNRRDTFLKKINHLKTHQLPLLYQEESSQVLSKLNLNAHKIEQQVCFLANLFVPKHRINQEFCEINNKAIVGYWIKKNEFLTNEYQPHQFYSPKKANWPVEPQYHTEWKSFNEILEQIEVLFQHQKAALLWMKKDNFTFERFFVVWW